MTTGDGTSRAGVGVSTGRGGPARRWWVIMLAAATIAYVAWLVVAHLNQIDRAVLRFPRAETRWLVAAVGFEFVSQGFNVVVQHRLLRRAGSTIGLPGISRLVLAQNAVGLAVPGGPAVASHFSYTQIRRRGTNGSAAAWVVAASNVIGMLAFGTFGAFTTTGTSVLTVVVAAGLVGALAVLVLLVRSPGRLRRPLIALTHLIDRIRRRPRTDLPAVRVDRHLARLSVVHLGWKDWLLVGIFAVAAVAADCGVWLSASHAMITLPQRCLNGTATGTAAQACASFHPPTFSALFVAYAAGQLALAIPFLPGGIGLVESFMTAALATAKTRAIPALSAVLLYRLVSFWAVVLIGGTMWVTLRRHREPPGMSAEMIG
jgi:putative heme transporter